VNKIALGIVAVAGIAGAAFAQATRPLSATYEFRLVPQGAASGLVSGGDSTLTSVTFVLQARATTANNTTNYGIHRLSTGAVAATNATLARASSNAATNFGRFRGPGLINNFAAVAAGAGSNSATGNAAGADATSNVNGRISADGRSIGQIDAWRGAQTASSNSDGDPIANPFVATLVTDGSASVWANLYSFTASADNGAGSVTVSASGFVNIAAFFADVGGNWTSDLLAAPTQVSTTFSWIIPTPGAAALLGLGGLVAGRRRR
jgi:uncharacterized protein (TIGR03382 family)